MIDDELDLIDVGEQLLGGTGDSPVSPADDDGPPAAEPAGRRNRQGWLMGVCRECGADASTSRSTYCDEHKPVRKPAAREPEGVGEITAPPKGNTSVARPRVTKGAPTGDEWSSKVFDKAVILLTALFAGSAVRRYGLNDPTDEIADSLTMTDDEARRVARPLGRFVAGTNVSRTYGRKVLDNSDLLDAAFALYDYADRVNRTLRTMATPAPLASVTPIHQPAPPAPEEGTQANGPLESSPQQPGIPDVDRLPPGLTGNVWAP